MQELIRPILYVCLLATISWVVMYSVDKTNKEECHKWALEAEVYPDYFITSWQKDQCTYLGIEVKAPVK